MSAGAFVATSRFKVAIELYNKIPAKKFEKIVTTILSRIEAKTGQVHFSDEETNQLKTLLGFNTEEIDIIITCTSYICDQSAYYNLSEAKLARQLVEHQLEEGKAVLFGQIWNNYKTGFIKQLREKTFGTPLILSDVDWRLNLTTSASDLAKTKQLNGIMSLTLNDVNNTPENRDTVQLEFSKDQLFELFEKLELLQTQLDNISK